MINLLLAFLMFFTLVAKAEENPDTWKPAAQNVCDQITQALQDYTKGDLKNAQSNALMAYFKGYDSEIEPAVRITLGGPHVFEIEHQFRDFKTAMKPNPDKKQLEEVTTLAHKLCAAMYTDAKALNDAKVKKQVFKVD